MYMFSKDDFTKENAQRLSVIIMTPFVSLSESQKAKFNRLLNEYINSRLLGDDWLQTLLDDFNRIVNEDILNEDFDPSKVYVPIYNTERQLL